MKNNKPLDQKNIIEKHTVDNQFKIGNAIIDLENRIKEQEQRILGLEEAMQFFSEWYNKTQRVDILVPESLKNEIQGKIIL